MTISREHERDTSVFGNPFSTRHVRPGAIPFLFAKGSETDTKLLVDRLARQGWRGEIVGPHGSGKSTLLASLVPLAEQAGRIVVRFDMHAGERRLHAGERRLHAGERRLHAANARRCEWNERTLVIVDGYEQLGWWSRRWLELKCRRTGASLLVTSHAPVGLPSLISISPSLEILQSVVARLLAPGDWRVPPNDVARVFAEQHGNVREALFGLYDLYELRRNSEREQ